MNVHKISKRNGKFRTIYSPSPDEKKFLREILPHINSAAIKADANNVAHGFRYGRSPITNAMPHIGWTWTLNMDLADFFDCVTKAHVPEFAGVDQLWPDGAARQGLPTSPALANIAAAAMDADICAMNSRGRFGRLFVYTRYADDLTLSFENEWLAKELPPRITAIAEKHGFKVNTAKTKLQWSKVGRRLITGVAVSATGVHAPRTVKRQLRAAKRRNRRAALQGLESFCLMKLPKNFAISGSGKPIIVAVRKAVVKTGEAVTSFRRAMRRVFDFGD